MSCTIGSVIDHETKRGTLLSVDINVAGRLGDVVYHHEWARSDTGNLVCVMWAGLGSQRFLHDLDAKELFVAESPDGLSFLDTD